MVFPMKKVFLPHLLAFMSPKFAEVWIKVPHLPVNDSQQAIKSE
jgi:hypothetical protein